MNECFFKLALIFCLYAVVGSAVAIEASSFLNGTSSALDQKVSSCSVSNVGDESGCKVGFKSGVHAGGTSLSSSFINSSLNASFDSVQGNLKSNIYQIAPLCVQVCVIYTDGTTGRCYYRCALGYSG